jgi:hypothetical protein
MVLSANRQAAQCATDDDIRFVLTNALASETHADV